MGVPYEFFYRLGFHPWEDLAEHRPFADKLADVVRPRGEQDASRPTDRRSTLAAGAGSGVSNWPKRGWQVTGVDMIENGPRSGAATGCSQAGVDMRLVQGDVTDLRAADIGSDFRLVLDTGHLPRPDR